MVDNLKIDGALSNYGIITGARHLLKDSSIVAGISENYGQMSKGSQYSSTELSILGDDTLRGSSRAADLNCALFMASFVAEKNKEELPIEEFNYFTFAEKMHLDVTSSQAISRHIISKELADRIKGESDQSKWFQFADFEEDKVQLFYTHSGYSFGGRRNHKDQGNPFGPTDCSEWLALLFKPELANEISTAELLNSADRQEQKTEPFLDIDKLFKYVPVSKNEPLVAGDILCKKGHVVGYLGEFSEQHITISAARNRGPVIGQGIDGVGIRIGDPLLNDSFKRFKVNEAEISLFSSISIH